MKVLPRIPLLGKPDRKLATSVVALNVSTSAAAEGTWVAGRFVLAIVAFTGVANVLSPGASFISMMSLVGVAFAANTALAWLLYRGMIREAFLGGLALDALTLLAGWVVASRALDGTGHAAEALLILLPLLVSGAARLGWPLGVAQAGLFALWVGGINVIFNQPSGFAVLDQSTRTLFVVATAGVALWLVVHVRRERARAEEEWRESEALAGLGRIISSSPDIDDVYQRFADAVRDLIHFDRLSVSTLVDEDGSLTLRYVDGAEAGGPERNINNFLEISLTGYVLQSRTPIRVGVGSKHSAPFSVSDAESNGFRSSLCAPVIADGRAIGALTLHSHRPGVYREEDEQYLLRVADQISGVLATELSHAREMQLIEAHSQLEAQNRELERVNEEKSKFLSTVSHELKTPLTSMLAFTDILKRSGDGLSDQQLDQLTVIQRNGRRLSILIDDLVDVAKFDAGTLNISMNQFDAREMLDDVVDSFEPIFEGKDQTLTLTAPEGPIWINADQARLAQVITNLISNASKYSPEGASVDVDVIVSGDRLGVAVRDNGKGISEEDQAKLFTPFFRVESDMESAVPGTGLGLAVSRSIVELHDGEITFESEPGTGSVFWISIPGVISAPAVDDEADEDEDTPGSQVEEAA